MRFAVLFLCAALGACALVERLRPPSSASPAPAVTTTLAPADASTFIITGGALAMRLSTPGAAPPPGQDAVFTLGLTRVDGASLVFDEAAQPPFDVLAQAPGGPLAQVMGFFGDEAPQLYHARPLAEGEAPFLCPPAGPVSLGVHEADDGTVSMVALRAPFRFETREDGTHEALPASPDMVCARMKFTRQNQGG